MAWQTFRGDHPEVLDDVRLLLTHLNLDFPIRIGTPLDLMKENGFHLKSRYFQARYYQGID